MFTDGPIGPWYRFHPRAAIAVAALLFAAVIAVRALDTRVGDTGTLLFVLPIALMAVTFGMRGGLVTAFIAYGIFILFALFDSTGILGFEGWIAQAVAMFVLGALLGRAIDVSRAAALRALDHQRRHYTLLDQNRRYADGIEISDSLLQNVAAAKWMVEQNDLNEATRLLAEAMERGQRMVGQLLPPQTIPLERQTRPAGPVDATDKGHRRAG